MGTKTKIKVEYNIKDKKENEMRKIDESIMDKIESIGGKWYAQGCDMKKWNRDIWFDLEIITKKNEL